MNRPHFVVKILAVYTRLQLLGRACQEKGMIYYEIIKIEGYFATLFEISTSSTYIFLPNYFYIPPLSFISAPYYNFIPTDSNCF